MNSTPDRLAALRALLLEQGLDGFLVPLSDEHHSEYVGDYARRLEWLTGFRGSAGTAVVLAGQAALFVDGRYTLQASAEVDPALYEHCSVPADSPLSWLQRTARPGATIGYDPWLQTERFHRQAEAALAPAGIRLKAVANPIDRLWADQPAPSLAAIEPFELVFSGREATDKRREIGRLAQQAGADAAVLAALDSIAWAFNIRGRDIHCTPVARAFAIVEANGSATLFVDPRKLTEDVQQTLAAGQVSFAPYDGFEAALEARTGTILVDPDTAIVAITQALARGSARAIFGHDPAVLAKACKNETELRGMRGAHLSDGLILTRFLASLDLDPPADELAAAERLDGMRHQSELLRDLSFDTISALGPNAALPHYRTQAATNRPFAGESIYLVDSGGQYLDGTTDVTRTVAVGPLSADMRTCNTLVLKGHIALAEARFPAGTRGGQLDILARQFLWAAGLDYQHGTGHGVGHYLSVHEGPQRIAAGAGGGTEVALRPGMVLSNEPGYYREGAFGIRIENLVIVVEDRRPGDEQPMLGFETITLAPIDRRLVDPSLLTAGERAWLDRYHERVRTALAPVFEGPERQWLLAATRPLADDAGAGDSDAGDSGAPSLALPPETAHQ